jgi:hypothetical protein
MDSIDYNEEVVQMMNGQNPIFPHYSTAFYPHATTKFVWGGQLVGN